jgi:hypothetical protein
MKSKMILAAVCATCACSAMAEEKVKSAAELVECPVSENLRGHEANWCDVFHFCDDARARQADLVAAACRR